MKILVAVMMTALIVFAGATAWVDYVQPQLDLIARAAQQKPPIEHDPPIRKRARKVRAEPDEDLLPVPAEMLADSDELSAVRESRPRAPVQSPEETKAQLNEQLDEVKQRELRIAARQEALRLMYDDIRSELAMLDEVRKRASSELAAAERGKTEVTRTPAVVREPAPVTGTKVASTEPPASLKNMSGSPANRTQALIMKRLVDQGKEDTAVSLLKAMKGREAAGILESLRSVAPRMAERLADSVPAMSDVPVRR